ncbi:MAG: GGDEF domain-containing protein [Thermoguttaceae bacterium]
MFDFTQIHLPTTVALAAVAAVGYLVGLGRSRDRSEQAVRSRTQLRQANQVAKELEKIAWTIRGNISRHYARLGQFKHRLNELQRVRQGEPRMLKSLADEAEAILTPTLRLASQIASAYDHIREQTDHLLQMTSSRTDPLTGIANRHFVEETLVNQFAAMRRYHTGFAVALFDVDQFQRVSENNDFHGDQVLQELAACLTDVARETDVVARFGSQDFVIVMPQTDLEGASYFAERYREAVDELESVTVSGGVTVALEGDDAGSLLSRLEESLQRAKHSGGNNVFRHDGIRIESIVESAGTEVAHS